MRSITAPALGRSGRSGRSFFAKAEVEIAAITSIAGRNFIVLNFIIFSFADGLLSMLLLPTLCRICANIFILCLLNGDQLLMSILLGMLLADFYEIGNSLPKQPLFFKPFLGNISHNLVPQLLFFFFLYRM